MKHNLKMRERLGALLLALLFIVQAVLGAFTCLRNTGGFIVHRNLGQ